MTMWQANLLFDALVVAFCTWLSILRLRPQRPHLRLRLRRSADIVEEAQP
jgi:hypothetical protein